MYLYILHVQYCYCRCTLAIDTDLQTLLESTHTRNLFLDDLLELKEFLNQRLQELTSENPSMLIFGQVYKTEIILWYIMFGSLVFIYKSLYIHSVLVYSLVVVLKI